MIWLRKIPGMRWLYLLFLRLVFRLLQARRFNRLVLERVNGVPLVIFPDVMNPRLFRTGAFFARWLEGQALASNLRVLDLGTGSGVAAVFAARHGCAVVATDVNPAAVRCAKVNALLNGLESRIEVRQGDLFAPVKGERFDLILFNPPYLAGNPKNAFERALFEGDVISRFAAEVDAHLAAGGEILLVLSTLADLTRIERLLSSHGFALDVAAEKHYLNETLILYRVQRQEDAGAQAPGLTRSTRQPPKREGLARVSTPRSVKNSGRPG